MADLQSAARLVMASRLIGDVVKEENDVAKVVAQELMAGIGAERVRVTDEGGTNLGSVSLSKGRVSARVVDDAAFLAWAKRNHPGEVMEVVRDSFKAKVIDSAKSKAEHGDPTAIGPDGEIVPGVEVVHGVAYVSTRPTAEARDRMRTMLANSGLFQLTSNGKVAGNDIDT